MENLEKKYNEELVNAGKKIKQTIDKSLLLFDDPMLLTRSIEYAMSPPILPKFGGIGKAEFFFKEKNSNVEIKEKNVFYFVLINLFFFLIRIAVCHLFLFN